MKATIGGDGAAKSWQDHFPQGVKCSACKRDSAVVAFVAHEGLDKGERERIIRQQSGAVRFNRPNGARIWPHDFMACAVYICIDCGEATAIWNQA